MQKKKIHKMYIFYSIYQWTWRVHDCTSYSKRDNSMWYFLYDSLTNFAKYKIIHYALICNFSMHTFPGSNPRNLEAFSQLHEWNLKITLIKYSYIKRARSSFTIWWTSTLLLMKREILTFQTWQWWKTNKRGVWFKLSPPSITWTGVTKVRYRARAIDQMELFCT